MSLVSCLENLHPGWSLPRLPQHHHISPPHSDWCTRHDQLKFSFSLYSLLQFLHTLILLSKLPFRCSNLTILRFICSRSTLISLTWVSDFRTASSSFSLSSWTWRSLSSNRLIFSRLACWKISVYFRWTVFQLLSSFVSSLKASFSICSAPITHVLCSTSASSSWMRWRDWLI